MPARLQSALHLTLAILPILLWALPWFWLLSPASEIKLTQLDLTSASPASPLISKSFRLALATGFFSLLLAGLIHTLIQQTCFRKAWLIFLSIPLLLSPYTFVQGWIHWLGDQGTLKSHLPLLKAFTLYSDSGLIFMQVLHLFPWALLLLQLAHRPLARNEREFCQMVTLSPWMHFRLLIWPRLALPLLVAFLWITLQAFWAYDIPSMLRQNLISLELMAAFGSFYELERALAILFQTWPVLILPLALISLLFWQRENFQRFLEEEVAHSTNLACRDALAFILSLLLLVIPISGLWIQMQDTPDPSLIFTNAREDFSNTLHYGFTAPLLAILFLSPILLLKRNLRLLFLMTLIIGLAIPSSVMGILWAQISSQDWWPIFLQEKFLMIFLLAIHLLPIAALCALLFTKPVSQTWKDFTKMVPHRWRLGWRQFAFITRPAYGWILLLLGLFMMREVPLILLHYPPGGGTLALTIETMLHFDQPGLVAGLSLFQLVASFILAAAFSTLSYLPR
ncbi:hypothetical protein AAFN60_19165 [Roseibacillus persicicus]|uniref:hypothetical protein n=1 Tax=Roseibacillus persicicus TaxID=454148 RepID=UPI00398A85F8